jgi:murein DD-endopeptidase MepM/ murein hydrolase activator NlpD
MSSYQNPPSGQSRHHAARSHSAAAVSRQISRQQSQQSAQRGYTIVHAGRQVRIGPVSFWIAVGFLIVMAVWTIGTGSYFAFKDDVLVRLIGRQAEMQFAYEDRIAELRAQVDRVTSRQLLDQEQFEKKLDALVQRHAVLEQRSSALGGDLAAIKKSPKPTRPMKPSPLSDSGDYLTPRDRSVALPAGSLTARLNKIALALENIEQRQTASVASMEATLDGKLARVRNVLAELNVDLGKHGDVTGAIGGPFVPAKPPSKHASSFEQDLYRVNVARAQYDRLAQQLRTIPVRKPVEGDIDMSSPFGMRMDPFLRGPAIHSGLDLRGDTGDPVQATANGTVVTASWQGGYGNMIEIDHHNGFSTRFGHLSKIEVKVGQNVKIGEVIGRIGSTGRSTGPHLHYETRVNDTAVDPQKFMRAGDKLGALN